MVVVVVMVMVVVVVLQGRTAAGQRVQGPGQEPRRGAARARSIGGCGVVKSEAGGGGDRESHGDGDGDETSGRRPQLQAAKDMMHHRERRRAAETILLPAVHPRKQGRESINQRVNRRARSVVRSLPCS